MHYGVKKAGGLTSTSSCIFHVLSITAQRHVYFRFDQKIYAGMAVCHGEVKGDRLATIKC